MKKILSFILIVTLAALQLLAGDEYDELTIKAYKKKVGTTPTYEARVIDALTGSLDVISKNKEIDMTSYVNKFLGTFLSKDTPDASDKLGDNAIFSFHVGGNMTGTFEVTITIQSLASYTTDSNGSYTNRDDSRYVAAQYWFQSFNGYFGNRKKTDEDSSGNTEEISLTSPTSIKSVAYGSNSASFTFSWEVTGYTTASDGESTITENTWDIEAMVAMILLNTTSGSYMGYSDSEVGNGVYKAPITIAMTVK